MLYIMNILSLSQRKEYLKIIFLEHIKTIKDVFFVICFVSVCYLYDRRYCVPFLINPKPSFEIRGYSFIQLIQLRLLYAMVIAH